MSVFSNSSPHSSQSRNDSTQEEPDKIGDISSINKDEDSDFQFVPSSPSRPIKPRVIDTHAHSHQNEFQKLHKERAEKKQDRLLRNIEGIIPMRVDETLMEEELAELASKIVGDHPQPNMHPTFGEQQDIMTKVS